MAMWQGSYDFVVSQWGVGHGGFHSQSLMFQRLERDPTQPVGDPALFRVVYDCGSGRGRAPRVALRAGLSRMLEDLPDGSTIDLLVISHFDRDHVNGLELLADELNDRHIMVARIWAPVLTGIEALVVASASRLQGEALTSFATFVANPEEALTNLFADADVSILPASTEPIPIANPFDDLLDVDDNAVVLVDAGDGLAARAAGAGTRTGGLADESLWELHPYVTESSLAGATAVDAEVRKQVGKSADDCSVDDLLALAGDAEFMSKFHNAVHAHHTGPGRGAGASSARTAPNLSTICLYSGPVSPYDWCHFRRGWDPIAQTPSALPIAPAWLGTGDAGLLTENNVDAMRAILNQSRLDRVGIASAPHHGSRHDSGDALWDALTNVRWVTIEANHEEGGAGNHHPHTEVLDALGALSIDVHSAVDGDDFHWRDRRIR